MGLKPSLQQLLQEDFQYLKNNKTDYIIKLDSVSLSSVSIAVHMNLVSGSLFVYYLFINAYTKIEAGNEVR